MGCCIISENYIAVLSFGLQNSVFHEHVSGPKLFILIHVQDCLFSEWISTEASQKTLFISIF